MQVPFFAIFSFVFYPFPILHSLFVVWMSYIEICTCCVVSCARWRRLDLDDSIQFMTCCRWKRFGEQWIMNIKRFRTTNLQASSTKRTMISITDSGLFPWPMLSSYLSFESSPAIRVKWIKYHFEDALLLFSCSNFFFPFLLTTWCCWLTFFLTFKRSKLRWKWIMMGKYLCSLGQSSGVIFIV